MTSSSDVSLVYSFDHYVFFSECGVNIFIQNWSVVIETDVQSVEGKLRHFYFDNLQNASNTQQEQLSEHY